MKRIFSFAIAALVLCASCNKQTDVAPAPTSIETANRGPEMWWRFWGWDVPCTFQDGNCLREVVVRPKVTEMLNRIIEDIQTNDGKGVKDLFVENQEELSAIFLDDDITRILSGDYQLAYNYSASMPDRFWFSVTSGVETLHIYPVDNE